MPEHLKSLIKVNDKLSLMAL